MEGLAPPLHCLLQVRLSLQSGRSVRGALSEYIHNSKGDYTSILKTWLIKRSAGASTHELVSEIKSPYRRTLLELFERGLDGSPILPQMKQLEREIMEACEHEIEQHLSDMPLISLVPLLLFQFPAFLILLFGPILRQFMEALHG